jgi:hypothetical protein
MKTITLVMNLVMLAIIGMSILSGGLPNESGSLILLLLVTALIFMNITIISGSSVRSVTSEEGSLIINRKNYTYQFVKILSILFNLALIGYVIWFINSGTRITGYGSYIYLVFLILYPGLSIIRIAVGKWNRFSGLRRTVLLTGIIFALLTGGTFIIIRSLIGKGIRENISIAKQEHPGKAEDALLAFLADSSKNARERTEIAIWTLGQIRSNKALPVLNEMYNAPDGNYYKGIQNSEISRYEIHKAIVSIEHKWMGAKEKNWFGSWKKLNQ